MPSLATRAGGVPTAVKDGLNGKLFSLEADIPEYCTYISDLLSERTKYKALAVSAFKEYDERLNWDHNANLVTGLINTIT